jgi:hypothetical protein
MMIQNARVIYRDTSVWARSGVYQSAPDVPLNDGEVLFNRDYPRDTPTGVVWGELRKEMMGHFFDIFYPAVVDSTFSSRSRPEEGHFEMLTDPDGRPVWQTRHVAQRQAQLPEFYTWNDRFEKFVMTPQAYIQRTEVLGGGMMIGVADDASGLIHGMAHLDVLQELNRGKTIILIFFIYPDRYDEEIRAMFELQITFWP